MSWTSKERLAQEAMLRRKVLLKSQKIKKKYVIMSGKGGVGKSMVTANLAIALAMKGLDGRIGVLDTDIHGANVPLYLGIKDARLIAGKDAIYPVDGVLGVKVVSMSFLLNKVDQPVVWRGPLKIKFVRDIMAEVDWGDTDVLLIDTPPGTGDELQGITQNINKIDGGILVTTPADLSLHLLKRSINFLKKMNIKPIGVIENMSYIECPSGKKVFVFGDKKGEIEKELGIPVLARIPMMKELAVPPLGKNPFILDNPDSMVAKSFLNVAELLL